MMTVTPIRTSIFSARDSLVQFIRKHVVHLCDGDIFVVTSKLLALAQGRVVEIRTPDDKERWIRKQSQKVLRTPWCFLTEINGEWCANSGVDESNADGKLILFPKGISSAAQRLRRSLMHDFRIERLGVLITDTRLIPMKRGSMGVAVGIAGFEPLQSYIGRQDLYGRPLKMTESNVAQALAAAAVFVMGEGDERCPFTLISGACVNFTSRRTSLTPLVVDPCQDLYCAAYSSRAPVETNVQPSSRSIKSQSTG